MKIFVKGLDEVKELKVLDEHGIDYAGDWMLNLEAEMFFDSDTGMFVMEEDDFAFWKKAIDKENDLNEFLNSFSDDMQIALKYRLADLYQNDVEEYPSIHSVFDLLKPEELSKLDAVEFVKIDSKNYGSDEFKLYCDEAGWQPWMLIYCEDDTIEERDYYDYDFEIESIEEVQKKGFQLSHKY